MGEEMEEEGLDTLTQWESSKQAYKQIKGTHPCLEINGKDMMDGVV